MAFPCKSHMLTMEPEAMLKDLKNLPSSKSPYNTMHDWYVFSSHIIDHYLPDARIHSPVPEEKYVTSLECRLHTPR